MASFVVHAFGGRKHAVQVTPMTLLSKVVEEAAAALKLKADPAQCKLSFKGKPVDLTQPVRFANIPNKSRLDLTTGDEPVLGMQPKPAAAPTQTQAQHSAELTAATAPTSAQAPGLRPEEAAGVHQAERGLRPSGGAGTAQQGAGAGPRDSEFGAAAGLPRQGTAGSGAGGGASAAIGSSGGPAGPSEEAESSGRGGPAAGEQAADPLGLGRQLHVFTREAALEAEAAERPPPGDDVPPEFYDFTADDYRRVAGSYAARAAREEAAPLRTAAMRREDERRRAAAMPPIPVRVEFPDGMILQASFKPLETLEALKGLVQRCLRPGLKGWHLYTTPPKQVIKDFSETFFGAGFAPAVIVHCGFAGGAAPEGPLLRPEVLALMGPVPKRQLGNPPPPQVREEPKAGSNVVGGSFQPSSTGKAPGAGQDGGGGKGMPKWMKLGK